MNMSRRIVSLGFRRSGSVFGVAALLMALGAVGCSKKKAEPEKATTPAPSASAADPNADGKRLERSLTDWKRRWDRIELEGCEPVLKEAAELELCTKAKSALTKVKDLASKADKSPAAMTAAGDLVLAAENAVEKLRLAAASELAGAASAKPGAPGAPKPAGSVPPKPKAKPAGSGAPAPSGSVPARVENPQMKVVSSYERVARTAARYLGSFLQQGPLEVRKQAFAEVQRLVPLREKWSALRDVVRQASLTEREPDLRKQLRDLEQKLRPARPPGAPSGAPMQGLPGLRPGPDGLPPSHPPINRPAPPAAPPPAAPAPQ
jgi:hypothetical protein